MCVNNFHWILIVIEISKNRLIIFDTMRKPPENYQQMVISSRSTMVVCRVWERFIDREHLSGCKAPLNIIHLEVSFTG